VIGRRNTRKEWRKERARRGHGRRVNDDGGIDVGPHKGKHLRDLSDRQLRTFATGLARSGSLGPGTAGVVLRFIEKTAIDFNPYVFVNLRRAAKGGPS
jgi:hypothetical protein